MNLNEHFITELKIESAITRKMLERVAEDKLDWKPHKKSRSLKALAAHIANLPGLYIASLNKDELNFYDYNANTNSLTEILLTFNKNITTSYEVLESLTNEKLFELWRYKYGEKIIFELPRLVVIRSTGINHLVHHRGQLSVYLRLINVPLPNIYGPTADES